MALTKVLRGGLSTGIADSSDATAITIDSSENVMMGGATSATSDITVGTASTDKRGIFIGSNQYRLGLKNASNNEVWLGSNGANSFTVSNASGSTLINVDSSGNIVLPTSSAGIYLGVTSATAANLLDDYEEGTFTPGLIDSAGGLGANLTTQVGQYTKVGNLVTFSLRINGDARTSTGNQVYVTGLPFTFSPSSTVNRIQFEVNGINLGLDSGMYGIVGQLANTDTSLTLYMQGTSIDNFRGHDLTPSYEIYTHGSYFTS